MRVKHVLLVFYPGVLTSGTFAIKGCVTFARMTSEKYNKNIYLIGDRHVNQPGICNEVKVDVEVPVHEFVLYLLQYMDKYSKKEVDFFIENRYAHVSQIGNNLYDPFPTNNQSMLILRFLLTHCRKFLRTKGYDPSLCPFKKVRVHNIDSRTTDKAITNSIQQEIQEAGLDIKVKTYIRDTLCTKPDREDVRPINKELRRLLPHRTEVYNELLSLKHNLAFASTEELIKRAKNTDSRTALEYIPLVVMAATMHTRAAMMELYALARMFKEDKTNIIIYAGDRHIQTYINTLLALGFDLKYCYSRAKDNECTVIPDEVYHSFGDLE